MNRQQIDQWFIDRVMAAPDQYLRDYQRIHQAVAVSNAVYLGQPCPFLYMPKFYTPQDIDCFKAIVEQMMGICKAVINMYFNSESLRKKYGFSERLERLILKESPYGSSVPMARFDFFYYEDNDFKFCELNTDGSSAMNEDMVLAAIMSGGDMMQQMAEHVKLRPFELFDTFVHELQNIYTEATGLTDKPTVAIVDFVDKSSTLEFDEFLARFKKYGYEAYIVDPRDLSYADGLYYQGVKIDVVYRRLVTRDMMLRIDEIPAFEQACLDDQTVIIGNIRSQIVHTKLFFKILYDADVRAELSEAQCAFIDAHVPATYAIADISDRLEEIVAKRADYILKPLDYYGSKGVYAGSDYTAEAWRTILRENVDQPYIIQAYCPVALTDNIDVIDGALTVDQFKNITGIYVYNEKVYGVYSRAGRKAILSGIHDVYTLPTFLVEE